MTTRALRSTAQVITVDQAPAWWVLGTRATIFTADSAAAFLIELLAPRGGSLDENFMVLAGARVIHCGQRALDELFPEFTKQLLVSWTCGQINDLAAEALCAVRSGTDGPRGGRTKHCPTKTQGRPR